MPAQPTPVFYLAPNGSDTWSGRLAKPNGKKTDGPWATLAGARDALRKLRASGDLRGDARVELRAGTYRVASTVTFGPDDSFTTFAAYAGEQPVIDGSEVLTGFEETTHNGRRAWVIQNPALFAENWAFRQLFVNGKRRPRARLPKFTPEPGKTAPLCEVGEIRLKENKGLFLGDSCFKPREGDIQAWPSLYDAEVVLFHYWVEERMPHPWFNPETGWVHFSRRSVFNLFESWRPELARFYVDNLFEALTDPGEWYLNRHTGTLYYLPHDGETLDNVEISAPRARILVDIQGPTYNQDDTISDPIVPRVVQGIRFEGLTFQNTDWYQPPGSVPKHNRNRDLDTPLAASPQAAIGVPGVIAFRAARTCAVTDCTLRNIGVYAIEIGLGCRNIDVIGNEMHDIGAGGIRIHGAELDAEAWGRTGHCRVTDNHIHRIGRTFHQAIGILIGNAHDNLVAHNHIHDAFYTGVSVGWAWGFRETVARNNRIENNLIHDIGQRLLSDLGAVYILGVQPGTTVRGNHVYNVSCFHYGGSGLYLDEGASHIVVEGNLVHDTEGPCFTIHFGRENVVRHNLFTRAGSGFMDLGRAEAGVTCATVTRNALVGSSKALYTGGYRGLLTGGQYVSDSNAFVEIEPTRPAVIYPEYRKDVPQHTVPLKDWQKAGWDTHSAIIPNGGFVKPKANDYTLKPNSPLRAYGIPDHGWKHCGPRPKDQRK